MTAKEAQALANKPELLAIFQRLVDNKIEQWQLEGAIEGIIGRDFDRMNSALDDICATADSGATCKKTELVYYLRQLAEDC